jgi:hypothetical protein
MVRKEYHRLPMFLDQDLIQLVGETMMEIFGCLVVLVLAKARQVQLSCEILPKSFVLAYLNDVWRYEIATGTTGKIIYSHCSKLTKTLKF